MQSVGGQCLVNEPGPRPVEDQPDPAIPVGRVPDRLVEPSDLQEVGTPHRRCGEDEVVVKDRSTLVGDGKTVAGVIAPSDDAPVDLHVGVARQQVEVGTQRGEPAERVEPAGAVCVVRVEQRDKTDDTASPTVVAAW